ncbi:Uncharacterised protein [Mycobacterium tuberculosis]|nr:Uncharacterised protein [Mycobacterium tuberculosis]
MDHGDFMVRNIGFEFIVFAHGTINLVTARVWSIQHDQFFIVFCTKLHYAMQRSYIRIETCSHILKVKNHDIDGLYDRILFFIAAIQGE